MRHHTLIAAAVLTGLAACSPAGEPATEPADAPAALSPGRPAIYQAAKVGPEEFVRALYAAHATPGAGFGQPPAPGTDPIFDRTLNALIAEDVREANGEVPKLNYDPICDCQDMEAFNVVSVAVTQRAPASAEAAVVFTNMGETKSQTLKLVKEEGAWKVSDIAVAGEKPLSQQLVGGVS